MRKKRFTILTRGSDNPEYIHTTGTDSHIWVKDKKQATRFFNDQRAIEHLQRSLTDNASIEHVYE